MLVSWENPNPKCLTTRFDNMEGCQQRVAYVCVSFDLLMFSRLAPKVLVSVMHDVFYPTKDTVISRAESMWHPTSRLPGAHYCRLNRVHCQMGCQCYGHHRFARRWARLLAGKHRRKPYISFLSVPILAKSQVFELATAKGLIAFRASLYK